MELDWSTFALEVVNFLILIWLLKRFFYQPVLNVIAQRRRQIREELRQASREQAEANQLKTRYEARLGDWETERQAARAALEQELVQERGKRLRQLDDELDRQRLKHAARDLQQQTQWRRQAETEALQLGAAFTSRLLTTLAGPELDRRLRQLFIDQLTTLPESALKQLHQGRLDEAPRIEVVSALPLDESQQQAIRQALEQRIGPSLGQWQFRQDTQLIAGLRISIGGWLLHANLQDELRFFSEAAHAE
ncbi:F0F1 ATP synthase subunit delta [Sedimenticola hydrogenitrophicus]|uniref:F0F1 ATP synthase subunit delta n=1 Tax=Sedimenticola hydrogenitrophicus TaxID=2967975 RepID=UPI0021A932B8